MTNLIRDLCKCIYQYYRDSDWKIWRIFGGIVLFLVTVAGLGIAVVCMLLAMWTAKKDFYEYCRDQKNVKAYVSEDCVKALNRTLQPPFGGHILKRAFANTPFYAESQPSAEPQPDQSFSFAPHFSIASFSDRTFAFACLGIFLGAVVLISSICTAMVFSRCLMQSQSQRPSNQGYLPPLNPNDGDEDENDYQFSTEQLAITNQILHEASRPSSPTLSIEERLTERVERVERRLAYAEACVPQPLSRDRTDYNNSRSYYDSYASYSYGGHYATNRQQPSDPDKAYDYGADRPIATQYANYPAADFTRDSNAEAQASQVSSPGSRYQDSSSRLQPLYGQQTHYGQQGSYSDRFTYGINPRYPSYSQIQCYAPARTSQYQAQSGGYDVRRRY